MGGLDPAKILIILLMAVIVLGPERLPRAARQVGSMWRELTKLRERLENEVRSAIPDLDLPKLPVMPQRGIAGYLTGMMTSTGSPANAGAAVGGGLGGVVAEDGEAWVRPGSRPVTNMGSDRSPQGRSMWTTSAPEAAPEHSELPAGWHAVGSPAPGYASGSTLSAVPSSAPAGPISVEVSLSFDEPSWN